MPSVTFRIDFKDGGVAFDPTSVVMSDPTSAYGVKDNANNSVAVAAGTAATKSATGSYYCTATATAEHTYTAYFKYVIDGETYYSSDTETAGIAPVVTTGPMTGAQIRAAANSRLGLTLTTDNANAHISEALRQIAARGRWPDLHETDSTALVFTVGLKSKDLPADFGTLDRLYVADDRTLYPEAPDALRELQETSNPTSDDPLQYCIIGGAVYVYPLPAASVTVKLDHWARPAAVTDETATLVLGDQFKEAVILGSMIAYMNTLGLATHPKMNESLVLYERQIATLLVNEDHKPMAVKAYRYC